MPSPTPKPADNNTHKRWQQKTTVTHVVVFVQSQEVRGRLKQLSRAAVPPSLGHKLQLGQGVQKQLQVSEGPDGVVQVRLGGDEAFDVRADLLDELPTLQCLLFNGFDLGKQILRSMETFADRKDDG